MWLGVEGLEMDWKIILLAALSAFVGSIGQLEYKRGASDLQFDVKLLLTNYHLIIGIAVYVLSTIFYIYALSKEQLSILYPIIATSYIWTTMFAKIFLKEPVGATNWIGVFFIILGIALIATRPGG